ncbi:MAG: ribosome biogenesis GTP-binding protein YihA/YsxC [Desulfovibrio sp.]|jgi:GTP-binding protein|nr:ribosome biogenesis GTP-binding protein YihA/YsxC [Desulfovibrio sp.]
MDSAVNANPPGERPALKWTQPVVELAGTVYTQKELATPPAGVQIALAGRSNVGKSSLLNALAGRKQLAKVSGTPGKTRSVNYYLVHPWEILLVDLPGYGYAKAAQGERRQWGGLVQTYLSGAVKPRALLLLLDIRLEPQKLDMQMATYAASLAIPVEPVLTKADKVNRQQRNRCQKTWEGILGVAAIVTSSRDREGIRGLWERIAALSGASGTEPATAGAP